MRVSPGRVTAADLTSLVLCPLGTAVQSQRYRHGMSVEWPDQRRDVVNGLDIMAADRVLDAEGEDRRWPDLTDAVHWVVDDTFWDSRDRAESIGTILVDREEAQAVADVAETVVIISNRAGAEAADATWCADPAWPHLQKAARKAAALLRSNGV